MHTEDQVIKVKCIVLCYFTQLLTWAIKSSHLPIWMYRSNINTGSRKLAFFDEQHKALIDQLAASATVSRVKTADAAIRHLA